jgi:hypothetical protein
MDLQPGGVGGVDLPYILYKVIAVAMETTPATAVVFEILIVIESEGMPSLLMATSNDMLTISVVNVFLCFWYEQRVESSIAYSVR